MTSLQQFLRGQEGGGEGGGLEWGKLVGLRGKGAQ